MVLTCTILLHDTSGESSTLILRNANYNRNSLVGGKLVSVLEGNVIFKYDKAIINYTKAINIGHTQRGIDEKESHTSRETYVLPRKISSSLAGD